MNQTSGNQPVRAGPTWNVSNQDQFLAMYDATIDEVFRYARRLTGDRSRAEDLTQQVYVELLQSARRDAVKEIGIGWLIVTVRSRFLNGIRSQTRETARLRLLYSNPEPINIAEPDSSNSSDGADELLAASPLTDRERAALTLRYVDDLPVAEVAAALHTTVRATESVLARARTRLRNTETHHA